MKYYLTALIMLFPIFIGNLVGEDATHVMVYVSDPTASDDIRVWANMNFAVGVVDNMNRPSSYTPGDPATVTCVKVDTFSNAEAAKFGTHSIDSGVFCHGVFKNGEWTGLLADSYSKDIDPADVAGRFDLGLTYCDAIGEKMAYDAVRKMCKILGLKYPSAWDKAPFTLPQNNLEFNETYQLPPDFDILRNGNWNSNSDINYQTGVLAAEIDNARARFGQVILGKPIVQMMSTWSANVQDDIAYEFGYTDTFNIDYSFWPGNGE